VLKRLAARLSPRASFASARIATRMSRTQSQLTLAPARCSTRQIRRAGRDVPRCGADQ
jgi:hypothetical protein